MCLTIKCCREIRVIDISPQTDLNAQKPLLNEMPDIIVVTPGRLLQHLKAGNLMLKHSLETLIIDEADLVHIYIIDNKLNFSKQNHLMMFKLCH